MKRGWHIDSWSRERGFGTITSDEVGTLPFDASRADVDDFLVGEAVLVELESVDGSFRVKRLAPDLPRFRDAGLPAVPDLSPEASQAVDAVLERLPAAWRDELGSATREGLVIEGLSESDVASVEYRLLVREPRYVALPWSWETRLVRRATAVERAHLATCFDWDRDAQLALTWITESRKFHFVVGTSLERLA